MKKALFYIIKKGTEFYSVPFLFCIRNSLVQKQFRREQDKVKRRAYKRYTTKVLTKYCEADKLFFSL